MRSPNNDESEDATLKRTSAEQPAEIIFVDFLRLGHILIEMSHPLEIKYGLSAKELLDAIDRRFRARVTLEGAVAEVHLKKRIDKLKSTGIIARYEEHDVDGCPDFSMWVDDHRVLRLECKNVRDKHEAYRTERQIVAYKVEIQKTRASIKDPSSRYYDVGYFDVLGVCLGKKTGNWQEFMFIKATDLSRHRDHANKLKVMQRVPLPDSASIRPWYKDLGKLVQSMKKQ